MYSFYGLYHTTDGCVVFCLSRTADMDAAGNVQHEEVNPRTLGSLETFESFTTALEM